MSATAIYMGRVVPQANFRTFIYGPEGKTKLVNSWSEYQLEMSSGVWFATKEEADKVVVPKESEELVFLEGLAPEDVPVVNLPHIQRPKKTRK